jgi:hypothetical protein
MDLKPKQNPTYIIITNGCQNVFSSPTHPYFGNECDRKYSIWTLPNLQFQVMQFQISANNKWKKQQF